MDGRLLPHAMPFQAHKHSGQEANCGLIQDRALMLLPPFCAKGERGLRGVGGGWLGGGRGEADKEGWGLKLGAESRGSCGFGTTGK